jgi:hypothetical protein
LYESILQRKGSHVSTFAENTSVPVDRTKVELDRLLQRHGASQRATLHDDAEGRAVVVFFLAGRQIRLQVPLPKRSDYPAADKQAYQTTHETPRRWGSMSRQQRNEWVAEQIEQKSRTRWRCMLLIVKAKLELIELSMSTVEREFLADIALPDGQTVGDWLRPGIDAAYLGGHVPPLLGTGK